MKETLTIFNNLRAPKSSGFRLDLIEIYLKGIPFSTSVADADWKFA